MKIRPAAVVLSQEILANKQTNKQAAVEHRPRAATCLGSYQASRGADGQRQKSRSEMAVQDQVSRHAPEKGAHQRPLGQ